MSKKNREEQELQEILKRRRFLTNFGLVLGGMGASPFVKFELLEKVAREFLPLAEAADGPSRPRVIEICLRAGAPLHEIAPFAGAQNKTDNSYNLHTPMNQVSVTAVAGNPGKSTYLSAAAAALRPFAENVAQVNLQGTGGHTPMFGIRNVSGTPSLSNLNAAVSQTQSVLSVPLQFGQGGVQSSNGNGMYPAASVITSRAQFQSNFSPRLLKLNTAEMKVLATAVDKLGTIHQESLKRRLVGSSVDAAKQAQKEGMNLLNLDMTQVINTEFAQLQAMFNQQGGVGPYQLAEAMALTVIGFKYNLFNSTMVVQDHGDWHGENMDDRSGNTRPARMAAYISNVVKAYIDVAKATPDPLDPSKTLFDNTLINISSEFSRGEYMAVGQDNSDGGGNVNISIGGLVNGGTHGMVDGGNRIMPASLYLGFLKAMKLPNTTINDLLGGHGLNPASLNPPTIFKS